MEIEVSDLWATGSVFNFVSELFGYSVSSEVVIDVAFRGNTNVLRGKTVDMDFIGFLEMDDNEKKSVCIKCLFSVEALLITDLSKTVELTRGVEAPEGSVERLLEQTVAPAIALGFREVNRECTGVDSVYLEEGLKVVFLEIWETAWGEVIIGRAAETLPFFNWDVCSWIVIGIWTEDENGFGEKRVEELSFNDIREVLDNGVAVLKYETVINRGKLVSELENLAVIGIWGADEVSAGMGAG